MKAVIRLTKSQTNRLFAVHQTVSDSSSFSETPPSAFTSASASSWMTSTMSSMVITPTRRSRFIDDRHRDEIVALEHPRDFVALLRHRDPAAIDVHDVFELRRAFRAQERVEKDIAEEPVRRIDDEDLEEGLRQMLLVGVAHDVDRLARGPERRRGDEGRLHQAAGGILRIVERALQLNPIGRRQRLQNFGLIFRFEIFEDADGIVAFEFADAFGDGLVGQLREDLLADVVVHFGQRGEIELRAHHLDELRAQLRFERDEKQAEIGFVQASGQRAHQGRIARLDGGGHVTQKIWLDRAIFVVNRNRVACDTLQFR